MRTLIERDDSIGLVYTDACVLAEPTGRIRALAVFFLLASVIGILPEPDAEGLGGISGRGVHGVPAWSRGRLAPRGGGALL